jgi:hypothetical protein
MRCGVAGDVVWQINGNAVNFSIGIVQFASVDIYVNGTLQSNGSIYWSGSVLAFGTAGAAGGKYQ